jgi:hypothetical protein
MIEFVTGEFQTFKVLRKVHLGSLGRDLREGQLVKFDGQTMVLGSEQIPYDGLHAAIRSQWVVPEEDQTSTYTPRANDIKITPAQLDNPNDRAKSKMSIQTVSDEQRVVGSLEGFNQRQEDSKKARTDQGGIPVGEVQVSDGGANSEFLPMDAPDTPRKKYAVVQEDVGDKIVKTVDGAMKTQPRKIPPARTKTVVGIDSIREEDSGGSSMNIVSDAPSEGVVVQTRKITTKTQQKWTEGKDQPEPLPQTPKDTVRSSKTQEGAEPRVNTATESPKEFSWDTSAHWQTRVKRAVAYKDQPDRLDHILSVEKPSVARKIRERLEK